VSTRSASGDRDGMSRWRWALFAAMARFEVSEQAYLRIPTDKVGPEPFLYRFLNKIRRRWRS
jgi:K+ transporter